MPELMKQPLSVAKPCSCVQLRIGNSQLHPDLQAHFQRRHAQLRLQANKDGADGDDNGSSVGQDSVAKLMAMGFDVDHCIYALEQNNEDIVNATNWLLNNLSTIDALIESKRQLQQQNARNRESQ